MLESELRDVREYTTTNTNKGGRPRKGSLEWRGGTWCGRVTVTVDGVSIRRWVRLETDNKVVARRKLARVLNEGNRDLGLVQSSAARGETYSDLATRVGARRKAEGIVDTESEDGRERKWIIPEIGHLLLTAIKGEHVAGIYEHARVNGKSLSHLRHLRAIMRSRFEVALAEDIIQQSPMARVRIPKAKIDRRERAVLSDTELFIYLSWTHPLEHRRFAVIERQAMSALARMFWWPSNRRRSCPQLGTPRHINRRRHCAQRGFCLGNGLASQDRQTATYRRARGTTTYPARLVGAYGQAHYGPGLPALAWQRCRSRTQGKGQPRQGTAARPAGGVPCPSRG